MARNVFVKAIHSRNFLSTRSCLNCFHRRILFSSKQKNDGSKPTQVVVNQEDTPPDFRPLAINWKRLKRTWMYFKEYTNFYKNNPAYDDDNNLRLRLHKEDEVIYYMRTKEDLEHWFIMTDEDIGGHSWAELKQGSNDMTMLFRGYTNQKPPNFMSEYKPSYEVDRNFVGSVFIETKPFFGVYDGKENFSTEHFNCYEIRLRGDGRRYWFETTCEYLPTERLVYRYPIYTRGGPLWEVVHIPFVKMHSRTDTEGKMILKQRPFIPNLISNFRFLLNDGIEGPFQLEIDYIAMTNKMKFGKVEDAPDVYDPWEPINVSSGA